MRIDWWTLGLQAANVLVLVFILSRFLFRPVVAVIEARQAAIANLLAQAEAEKAAARGERDKAAAEAERNAAARSEVLEAAAAEAGKLKAAVLASAREEADHLRAAAEAERAKSAEQADREAADRASLLAVDIAAKILAGLPDEMQLSAFIDGLLCAIAALPESARIGLGASDEPIRVKAARAPTGMELDRLRRGLSGSLGREVDVAVTVDPGLIAGLELDMPHALVRNSIRASLDRVAAELVDHEPA